MLKYCLWVRAKNTEGIRIVREALVAAHCSYTYTEPYDPFCGLNDVSFTFTSKIRREHDGLFIGKLEKPISYNHLTNMIVIDDNPRDFYHLPLPRQCPGCKTRPGQPHSTDCEAERCSVCGGRRRSCDCEGHDPLFARWTGFWPGRLEATALRIGENELAESSLERLFTIKPLSHEAAAEGMPDG